MTLPQPQQGSHTGSFPGKILCHKCGAPIVFSKDRIAPTGRKIPLDPYFNNEPHQQHCMYSTAPSKTDTDALFFDLLSLIPSRRQSRIIGAGGTEDFIYQWQTYKEKEQTLKDLVMKFVKNEISISDFKQKVNMLEKELELLDVVRVKMDTLLSFESMKMNNML